MDDRRRPVAQRDHLALAARLEARRHREQVRAGVDPARHRPVEPLDQRDPFRVGRGERPERSGQRPDRRSPARPAGRPRSSSAGAASDSRSKPFCGSSRPIIPMTGPSIGRIEADPRQQVRPAGRLAGQVGPREYGAARSASVAGSQTVVSSPLRIPMNRSPISRRRRVEAHPEGRRRRLRGESGRDRVDELGALDRRARAGRSRRRRPATMPSPGASPSWARAGSRRPAVVGQVVEGRQDGGARRRSGRRRSARRGRSPPARCASRGGGGRRAGARPRAAPRAPPGRTARTARRCRRSRRRRRRRSRRDRRRPGGRPGAGGSRRPGRR